MRMELLNVYITMYDYKLYTLSVNENDGTNILKSNKIG